VIKNVNLTARSNEMIALVGAERFRQNHFDQSITVVFMIEPDSGEIFIDGHNILSVTLRSLRDAISLVTQDIFLF